MGTTFSQPSPGHVKTAEKFDRTLTESHFRESFGEPPAGRIHHECDCAPFGVSGIPTQ
jgi:hypothetical protein